MHSHMNCKIAYLRKSLFTLVAKIWSVQRNPQNDYICMVSPVCTYHHVCCKITFLQVTINIPILNSYGFPSVCAPIYTSKITKLLCETLLILTAFVWYLPSMYPLVHCKIAYLQETIIH